MCDTFHWLSALGCWGLGVPLGAFHHSWLLAQKAHKFFFENFPSTGTLTPEPLNGTAIWKKIIFEYRLMQYGISLYSKINFFHIAVPLNGLGVKDPNVGKFSNFFFELFGPMVNCGERHPVVLQTFVLTKHPNLLCFPNFVLSQHFHDFHYNYSMQKDKTHLGK